jgi:hypothetical protein
MKRFLVLVGTLLLSSVLAGCGGESRDDLISATVNMMNEAASEIDSIQKNVNDAVKKSKESNAPLDFTDAIKKCEKLKQRLQVVAGSITEDERKTNEENNKQRINDSFHRLVKARDELQQALDNVEALSKGNVAYQTKAKELRDKLKDALSPYETMSRQTL